MITAHGGALGTGRNSKKYFDAVLDGTIKADCLEVDVWARGDYLFISHMPALFYKKKIPLKYVFEVAKKMKVLVNFDLKQRGIFTKVRDMAIAEGAEEYLLYTGATRPDDIKDLTVGQVYANCSFFPMSVTEANLPKIKEFIDSLGNPRLKGLNIGYGLATDSFIAECKRLGLGLSIYTVDDYEVFKRLYAQSPDNVTTNRPDFLERLKGEQNG